MDAQGVVRAVGKRGNDGSGVYIARGIWHMRRPSRISRQRDEGGRRHSARYGRAVFCRGKTTVYATPSFGYVFDGWYEGEER